MFYGCDICGSMVAHEDASRHGEYHEMIAQSFVGFIEIIKAIAGPEFQVVIDRLEGRHEEEGG